MVKPAREAAAGLGSSGPASTQGPRDTGAPSSQFPVMEWVGKARSRGGSAVFDRAAATDFEWPPKAGCGQYSRLEVGILDSVLLYLAIKRRCAYSQELDRLSLVSTRLLEGFNYPLPFTRIKTEI